MVNILKGYWETPQEIIEEVEEIKHQIQQQKIHILHIFREGNQLADYLANEAVNEPRTLIYYNFKQLSK